jgi:hypothetical protein
MSETGTGGTPADRGRLMAGAGAAAGLRSRRGAHPRLRAGSHHAKRFNWRAAIAGRRRQPR